MFAQCAMCYQNAAAQGARGMRALNLGILILLLPPLAIAGCITRLAYRYRDSRDTTELRQAAESGVVGRPPWAAAGLQPGSRSQSL